MPRKQPNIKMVFEIYDDDAKLEIKCSKGKETEIVIVLLSLYTQQLYQAVLDKMQEFVKNGTFTQLQHDAVLVSLAQAIKTINNQSTSNSPAIKPSQVFR